MRKKIVLIGLVAVFVLLGVVCYKSWFIGFVITKYLSGRTDGTQGIIRSITIPWRDYRLHLHHWFLALVVGGVLAVKSFYILAPEVFYGLLSAVVFQGIYCYEDWYRIIKRRIFLPALNRQMSLAPGNSPESLDQDTVPVRCALLGGRLRGGN